MGCAAFLVGGTVRDMVLGVKNLDLDIVVEGPPDRCGDISRAGDAIKLGEKLLEKFGGALVVHRQFGTCTLVTKKGLKIDLATARKEIYARPAALPTVEFSSLKDDLARRDFTINSMAVSINKDDFGRLIDLCGGKSDLERGIIRVMHDKSFIDDPTRIFRARRFASRLGFSIEPHTLGLMRSAVKKGMLAKLSKYRINKELAAGIIRPGKI